MDILVPLSGSSMHNFQPREIKCARPGRRVSSAISKPGIVVLNDLLKLVLSSATILLLVGSALEAAQLVQQPVQVAKDLVYRTVGGRTLKLDLYRPSDLPAGARAPLVVWIHGGAWRSGSKSPCPALPLVHRGYIVASISYSLTQDATFPAQIHDCKAAIRWLRANASVHSIDPDRIGVWGASSGGHLAALLGTSGDVRDLEGGPENLAHSSRVQAVCDFFGPTDFLRMNDTPGAMDHDAPDSPESALIGGPIQQNRDKVARANPITYITADDPPFLILHGDQDNLVPITQSQLLYEALQRAGIKSRFGVIKGAGHGFGTSANKAAFDFFDQVFKADK
jgi:acetyl esterase/lipase